MKIFFRLLAIAALVTLPAGCSEDDEPTRNNDFIPLSGITIESQYPRIAAGTSNQFRAIGDFSGVFTRDITGQVTWSVTPPDGTLTISNDSGSQGLATSVDSREVTVTARMGDIERSVPFSVTNARIQSITISPSQAELPKGLTQQFTATGVFDQEPTEQIITRNVAWASADATVVSIDNSGLATAVRDPLAPGPTQVTSTFSNAVSGNASASANVTVVAPTVQRVDVTPVDPAVARDMTLQFTAKAIRSDETVEDITATATWSSSNLLVATMSSTTPGLATTVNTGTTTVTATDVASGRSGTSVLTVAALNSITVTAPSNSVAVDDTLQLVATGRFSDGQDRDITDQISDWRSRNQVVATVSATGVVRGEQGGTTVIEANLNGKQGTFSITVTSR